MKKRNAKTLVISLALMLVMCVATTLLSFSLADDAPGTGGTGGTDGGFNTTKTNIDYIIQNSKSADKDEAGRDLSPFYIVEIGSAANDSKSPLKAMLTEDLLADSNVDDISHFVKQVINGWSTQNEQMAPNKISYQYISVASLTDSDPAVAAEAVNAAIAVAGKADLVYVSNNPDSKYSASKDIPEDLKLFLSGMATSTYTPFIIDSPTKTQNGGNGTTASNSFNSLATNVFAKAGYYRDAFAYDTSGSTNVTNFLNRLDTSSLWIPIGGKTKSVNWYKDADGNTTARILTIHSGDTDNAITNAFKTACGTTTYDLTKLVAVDPTYDVTGKEAYEIDGTDFYKFGYLTTEVRPKNVVFETITPDAITADADLGVYDLVIIEKGVNDTVISADLYNMFSSMVYGMQHIVYDSSMKGSKQGEDQQTIITSDAANYQYIVNKVADSNEVSRFANVLVTGMAEMKVYGAATAPSGVKAIADIINNGSYRGSGGGGSSSNLYTVLEIQPCYPIDLNLAKTLQDRGLRATAGKDHAQRRNDYDRTDIYYYIHYDSVLNNTTSDEISFDGGITSLADMESTDDATTGISSRGALTNTDKIYCKNVYAQPAYAKRMYAKPMYAKRKRVLTQVDRSVNNNGTWTTIKVYDSETYWDGSNNRDVVDDEGYIVYKGEYLTDDAGNPVYETDDSGNIILFEDKSDIQFGYVNASGQFVSINNKYDNGYVEYGYKLDSSGNVQLFEDKSNDSSYVEYEYKTDASGKVILYANKNNNAEYVRYGYMTDESGNIIFKDTQQDGYEAYGTVTNAVDYYAWELSKAKVAFLTGLDYNKVNVVHMSTVEFNTSRETLMDNYDAIYIGGNWTALKSSDYIINQMEGRGRYGRTDNPTAYSMYYHNGATYNNGEGDGVGVLTGNDITYSKYVELQKYIAAGMPVVFTKAATEAYYGAKLNGFTNRLMDPESNVFKLMDGCMNSTAAETSTSGELSYPTKQANVLAGFDPADQIKVANNGSYGSTYGGYVTVFGGVEKNVYIKNADGKNVPKEVTPSKIAVNAEEFSNLLKTSFERPKFSLLQAPASYIEGDVSTEITGNQIKFKFDIASKENYTVNVYVDDNTNSRFEDKEVLFSKQNPGNSITCSFANSFDGALYWKFEVVSGGCRGSVTGLSKVKVKTKNYVNVLQIAPAAAASASINSDVSLLFCTECQEARGILKGNRWTNVGKYSSASAYNGPVFDDGDPSDSIPGTLANPATYDTGYTNIAANKNLGIHRHNFGIVKYDSNYTLGGYTGLDNWETNWAEDVYNDYDIDMDIWTTRQFEANVADAMTKVTSDNADTVIESYKSLASIYKNYYLTMQQLIAGKVDTASTNYTYLKNKLTKTDSSFIEADVNQLFGEDKSAYALESAKGGFHVSEDEFANFQTAQATLDNLLRSARGKLHTDKATDAQLIQEVDYELKYHRYSDFFSLYNASSQVKVDGVANFYTNFVNAFAYWRNAKIYEEYFYKMYMKYLTYSTMKEYKGVYTPDYTQIYSCIVVGVGENFGGDDINTTGAINALKFYIENDGNTFIFHQTINDSGSTANLTANLKKLFGQDYNHQADTSSSDTNRYHYTKLKTDGTTIATSATHKTFYNTGVFGNDEKEGLYNWTQTGVLKSDNEVPTRHINFISDASQYGWYTDRAIQNNQGVVTMYPFLIASELKISGTHPNSFSTDIEDDDLIVYYSLAGGADGSHSSISAADPKDGIDDYFIYSYGSVTYCGAGHTLLTGRKRDNNDERRLFINIILNSAKKSVFGPTIDVFDPYPEMNSDGTVKKDEDGNPLYTNNDITRAEDGSYEMTVSSMESIPEFTYKVTIPDTSDDVSSVKIYYDLSSNDAAGDEYGFVKDTDVLIFQANSKNDNTILKNKYKLISGDIDALKLDPRYFVPYGQKYTYIVIAVKTKKGIITTQRIMVKVAPKLWDLT